MSEKKLEQVNVRLRLVDGNGLYSDEQIKTPEDAVRVMAEAMAELDREELCVVNMDSKLDHFPQQNSHIVFLYFPNSYIRLLCIY